MQAVLQPTNAYKNLLEWCLLVSLIIHLLLVLVLPTPRYDHVDPPKEELSIELLAPEPPAPPAPPELPTPQPPTPQPLKPLPEKVTPMPLKKQEPLSEPVQTPPPPAPVVSTAPPVIAAKPSVSESKPEVVVPPPPPPEPPRATGPSDADLDAARNAFRAAAHRELKKHQRYPRIAADRGIEGDVKLNIHLDDNGNVTGVDVEESSGNNALDNAALEAAKKANLKSYFQDILRGRVNNIVVTVSFKLAS